MANAGTTKNAADNATASPQDLVLFIETPLVIVLVLGERQIEICRSGIRQNSFPKGIPANPTTTAGKNSSAARLMS
jgi:hypothetical protein